MQKSSLIIIFLNVGFFTNISAGRFKATITDLEQLLDTDYFIDKSIVIKVFFMSDQNPVMISGPRRFGKSVNMDIMKRFCQLIVDENGKAVPRERTDNFKLFQRHKLKIYEDAEFFKKHFGRYPAICLDFRDMVFNNYQMFLNEFKRIITKEFANHKYLLGKLTVKHVEYFNEYFNQTKMNRVSEHDLHACLEVLSRLLTSYFKTKPVILIDHYDAPVQHGISHNIEYTNRIVTFLFGFTSLSLKANRYAKLILVNTIFRLAPVLPPGTLPDQNYYTVFQERGLVLFYGFTEPDVIRLLKKWDLLNKLQIMRKWYSGYEEQVSEIKMYNPYAVLMFLEHKDLRVYSVEPNRFEVLFKRDEVREKIKLALTNNTIFVQYAFVFNVQQIEHLKNMEKYPELSEGVVDIFLQYLADQGYFNVIINPFTNEITLQIPNEEIRQYFQSKVLDDK